MDAFLMRYFYKKWRPISIILITILYLYLPIGDYFYAKENDVSFYSGLVGWLLLIPVYIGFILIFKFVGIKKSNK